jgi:transposase InsO family protein
MSGASCVQFRRPEEGTSPHPAGQTALEGAATFEYIEVFYNTKRRPSSMVYVSPAEYERAD